MNPWLTYRSCVRGMANDNRQWKNEHQGSHHEEPVCKGHVDAYLRAGPPLLDDATHVYKYVCMYTYKYVYIYIYICLCAPNM